MRHKQKASRFKQLAPCARPLLSFTLPQTVMCPETEESSCRSDHKAESRGVNCFPTEKELVQTNHHPPQHQLKSGEGRDARWAALAELERRVGAGPAVTRLDRAGREGRFRSRMSTHMPNEISGYSNNNGERQSKNDKE